MLEHVVTEQSNPASAGIDRLNTQGILEVMNDLDSAVPRAVRAEIPRIAQAVDRIVAAIRAGGRVYFLGAGSSGRLGVLESAECPPTFSVAPEVVQAIMAGGEAAVFRALDLVEDDPESGASDLVRRGFTALDVLVGISASGESAYVLGAVERARGMGAVTIGICCSPTAALARSVSIPITPLTGPEVIAGSTRLKAGTATKLVLNMLTTASMIRLGHVFGNLMVNVQPNNRKLRERARRIIGEVTGVEPARAEELLQAAGESIKVGIVMHRLGITKAEAESRLMGSDGQVAAALEADCL